MRTHTCSVRGAIKRESTRMERENTALAAGVNAGSTRGRTARSGLRVSDRAALLLLEGDVGEPCLEVYPETFPVRGLAGDHERGTPRRGASDHVTVETGSVTVEKRLSVVFRAAQQRYVSLERATAAGPEASGSEDDADAGSQQDRSSPPSWR